MLIDKFKELQSSSPTGKCLLGKVIGSMDEGTLEIFTEVMKNKSISADQICKILNEDGHTIGVSHIRQKRRDCFLSDEQCKCMTGGSNE